MADNFLERHMAEYEAKKEAWLKRKKLSTKPVRNIEKPEDESL